MLRAGQCFEEGLVRKGLIRTFKIDWGQTIDDDHIHTTDNNLVLRISGGDRRLVLRTEPHLRALYDAGQLPPMSATGAHFLLFIRWQCYKGEVQISAFLSSLVRRATVASANEIGTVATVQGLVSPLIKKLSASFLREEKALLFQRPRHGR